MLNANDIEKYADELANYLEGDDPRDIASDRSRVNKVLEKTTDTPTSELVIWLDETGLNPYEIAKGMSLFQIGAYIAYIKATTGNVEWIGGPTDEEIEKADREQKEAIDSGN